MENYTRTERAEYNNRRIHVCNELGITISQYNWFRRHAEQLHKLYENACNGFLNAEGNWDEAANLENEAKITAIENKILDKCSQLDNLDFFFQADPRGASLYLSEEPDSLTPSNYTNGVAIY